MIRHMTQSAAEQFIDQKFPRLTPAQRLDLIAYARPIGDPKTKAEFVKGKFYATAWLCGATYGQIAALYNVTPQTVSHMVNRYVPASTRDEFMTTRSKHSTNIQDITVAVIHAIYERMSVEQRDVIKDGSVMLIYQYIKAELASNIQAVSVTAGDVAVDAQKDAFNKMFGQKQDEPDPLDGDF
jgi:hypothetical protein